MYQNVYVYMLGDMDVYVKMYPHENVNSGCVSRYVGECIFVFIRTFFVSKYFSCVCVCVRINICAYVYVYVYEYGYLCSARV